MKWLQFDEQIVNIYKSFCNFFFVFWFVLNEIHFYLLVNASSFDISNGTTIVHWIFWFIVSNTWMISQNFKCSLLNSTGSHAMYNKKNRMSALPDHKKVLCCCWSLNFSSILHPADSTLLHPDVKNSEF
ncbi:hypothetical protein Ahy_B03g063224 isoform D [Arachis hypogaea]|uniref:Uncharacterized protein n=1 Tax=Arachis hypogaea TaxID=3818 RepID=A0A444ZWK5_ARAHY|nr:hypothetical protein Ahy_B03g063224 isoform D [Arachis hypogaea]